MRPRKKATLKQEILEFGYYNNLALHRKCSIFFSKFTPPYPTGIHNVLYFFLRECLKNFVAAIIRLDSVVLPRDQVTAVCCICVHSAGSTLSSSDQKSSSR